MKKLVLLMLSILFLLTFNSCKKDEETKTNYFSFDGKDYTINESGLVDLVFYEGTDSSMTMHIFLFDSYAINDTTSAIFTLLDAESNILSGNYPSIDMGNTTATKVIVPFAFFFFSGIEFQDETFYFTGNGGSIDIAVSGNDYDISMNDISAGEYADIFDMDPEDGDFGYTEAGKISGKFNGTINKQTQILSLGLNNKIEKIRKSFEGKLK